MSIHPKSNDAAIRLLPLALVIVLSTTGCSLFPSGGSSIGSVPGADDSLLAGLTGGVLQAEASTAETYVPVGDNATLPSGSFTQEVHQAVRKAKHQNAIVLQVLGNDEPVRILPLPTGSDGMAVASDQSPTAGVFVSTLLKQTGVQKKYGRIQAALYRPSPSSFEGVRMDVLFATRGSDQVRPESDYALRAGDRLVVREDNRAGLDTLLDMALGR